jgi:hypothetical protein
MITAESLIQVFFEAALVHKPNMSPHQIHLYVLGLMAHELAFAFNNDFTVAQNVREVLEKLNPSEPVEKKKIAKSQSSNDSNLGEELNKSTNKTNPLPSTKKGSDLMSGLSYSKLKNYLNNYPKIQIKDYRDEENGLLWIDGSKIDLEDEKLSNWLIKNKFVWSKEKSAWYFSII